jgi:subtilase family serine protease
MVILHGGGGPTTVAVNISTDIGAGRAQTARPPRYGIRTMAARRTQDMPRQPRPPAAPASGFCRPARRLRAAAGLAAAGMLLAAGGCRSPAGPASQPSPAGTAVADCLTQALCYAPRQFRVAYGIQPLLDGGVDGRGQTVVLLEFAAPALPPPRVTDIRQDLARFDHLFSLPAARLQIINSLARSASPWLANGEEVEDTEIVHAAAPGAAIREVLIDDQAQDSPAAASTDLAAALRLGLTQGAVISFSHSWGERCFTTAEVAQLNSALQAARIHDVTVINSSGDIGAVANPCPGAVAGTFPGVKGVNLLDADPLVLAAGGTSLQASRSTGAYAGESVWNSPPGQSALGFSLSSGGGFSQRFPRPAYQDGVAGIGTTRGVPDVAADADGATGMAMALSDGGQRYILAGTGGTSAAAPLWAAVIALADQYDGRPLGFINPAIYRIGRSPSYRQAFHDITTGTNTIQFPQQTITITGYRAAPGWDPATGWGSPNAHVLVPLLARYASPAAHRA